MSGKILNREQVTTLRDNGAIRTCTLKPIGGKWSLFIATKTEEYQVAKQRSKDPKLFTSIDTACQFVRELGLGEVTIEMRAWTPRQSQLELTTTTSSA